MAEPSVIDETLAIENKKTVAGMGAFATAVIMDSTANLVTQTNAHLARMNILAETAMARNVEEIQTLSPREAAAESKTLRADFSELAAQVGSLVAMMQQWSKTAGVTPPVTIPTIPPPQGPTV